MNAENRATNELRRYTAIASLASIAIGLSGCSGDVYAKTPAIGCRAEVTDIHRIPGEIEMEYTTVLGTDGTVKPRHTPIRQPDTYELSLKTVDCFSGDDPQQLTVETDEATGRKAHTGVLVQYSLRGWQLAE
ncbi:MAG: hypothetical protein Q4A37_01915 [Candidatus Saccharibacteria bacterium]|nr:hypothetical protein [Candidatus Saccharibacteria bacterium]